MTDTFRDIYDMSYPPSLWAEPETVVMAKAPKTAKASTTPEAPPAEPPPPPDEPPPDEPPAED